MLRENAAMRDLALSHGFTVDRAGSDADALRLVLALNEPLARGLTAAQRGSVRHEDRRRQVREQRTRHAAEHLLAVRL